MSSIEAFVVIRDESFRLMAGIARMERARAHAARAGHAVALTFVPDEGSEASLAWLEEYLPPGWGVAPRSPDGLAATLAAGIAASPADLAGVMAPGDAVSEEWFTRCAEAGAQPMTCWMPQAVVTYGPNYFDRGETAFFHLAPTLDAGAISEGRNALPGRFMAPRALLAAHPFPQARPELMWGEPGWTDGMQWWWACRLLAAGATFQGLPGTIHFRAMPDGGRPDALLNLRPGLRLGPFLPVRGAAAHG